MKRLIVAGSTNARRGNVSDAAIEIVNRFHVNDLTDEEQRKANWHASSPYWSRMLCILAERCARAEHIAEIERSRRFGAGESDDKQPITEEWLQSEFNAECDDSDAERKWRRNSRWWRIDHDAFPLLFERHADYPEVWSCYVDYRKRFPVDIHVREQVRLLVRMCHEI